jgi:hypothetical protein
VDGRYEFNPSMPECSEPGADAGRLMTAFAALLSLGIDIDDAVADKVCDAVVQVAGGISNFHFHTDKGSEDQDGGVAAGCGHVANALADPGSYGLDSETTFMVERILQDLKAKGATQEVLHGGHKEGAVLVVKGERGIAPNFDGDQAFVYQETMAEAGRDQVAKVLAQSLGIDLEKLSVAMNDAAEKQLNETLKRLAANLPVFVVTESEGEVEVSPA